MFKSRADSALKLAERLSKYRGKNPLVLGIPRGAVPMARVISNALGGELDVVLVHKLRAPGQPELAIGSVDEEGHVYLNRIARDLGISDPEIEAERKTQVRMLQSRRNYYTPVRPPVYPAGRIVIVVDDGLATGASMIAALRSVRTKKPLKLVMALPVASREGLEEAGKLADETVCLLVPELFYSVGQFYESFDQVSDDEVIKILREETG
ncbi:MAG TPA: phosphoribosyltransferase family protein [Nitrospiria bacterium]|nr:phosphoribosyltransferase family protein [Nitrospiria bacterium]